MARPTSWWQISIQAGTISWLTISLRLSISPSPPQPLLLSFVKPSSSRRQRVWVAIYNLKVQLLWCIANRWNLENGGEDLPFADPTRSVFFPICYETAPPENFSIARSPNDILNNRGSSRIIFLPTDTSELGGLEGQEIFMWRCSLNGLPWLWRII